MSNAVIIPAYNERDRIALVVQQAKQLVDTVIVVDDGSQDGTATRAREAGAVVLRHKINLGKGAALKTGCDYAVSKRVDKMIVLDADGQHDPKHIPTFLASLDSYDLVFGARKVPDSMPYILRFGNVAINKLLHFLYGLRLEDSQCGYRALSASAYKQVRWEALNYYVETEMILRAGRKRLRCIHIPIETIYSDKYKGTTVIDGVLIVGKMIGWRLFK